MLKVPKLTLSLSKQCLNRQVKNNLSYELSKINRLSTLSSRGFAKSTFDMSGIQMKHGMTVTQKVLDQQVEILNNENIPGKLKNTDEYIYRHMGNSAHSTQRALDFIGCESMDQLMDQVVPAEIRLSPESMFRHGGKVLEGIDSETLMTERMRQLASNNVVNKSYIGQGYYGTTTPAVIRRNVLENPKWYTPYTPYQAEIA